MCLLLVPQPSALQRRRKPTILGKTLVGVPHGESLSYLGNFAQRSALLAKVYHYATASILGLFHRFLYAEKEVWTTGTDVRTENITAVALKSQYRRLAYTVSRMISPHRGCEVKAAQIRRTSWLDRRSSTLSGHLNKVSCACLMAVPSIHEPIGGRNSLMSPRVMSYMLSNFPDI